MYFSQKKFKSLEIIKWENLKEEIKNYDIIINATSLGLKIVKTLNLILKMLKQI